MWIYIQSIFVYLTLMVIMVALGETAVKKKKYGYIVIAISIYSIVFGMRYGVGMDYFGYLDLYDTYCRQGYFSNDNLEYGFKWLIKLTSIFHSSFVYFSLIAFLNLFFMTLGLKENLRIYPYIFFIFMLTGAWMTSANLARQSIAIALWVYSVKFAVERKIVLHYIFVLAAICFHYSAIILVIFYPLFRYKDNWFKNVKIELGLLAVALVFMNLHIIQDVMRQFDGILAFAGYDIYMTENYEELMDKDLALGIGFFINLLIHTINIWNSEKVKAWIKNPYYNALYSLYFMGVLLSYVFASSEMMGRINLFFLGVTYIITSFTLFYSVVNKKQTIRLITTGLVALIFVAIMYKASTNWNLFVFKGQQEYYYLHKEHDRR